MTRPLQILFIAMGVSVTSFLGCVGSDVTVIGERYPALPPGCPVAIFPSTTPNYGWKDIATSQAKCNATAGRSACIERLKKDRGRRRHDVLVGRRTPRRIDHALGDDRAAHGWHGRRVGRRGAGAAGVSAAGARFGQRQRLFAPLFSWLPMPRDRVHGDVQSAVLSRNALRARPDLST